VETLTKLTEVTVDPLLGLTIAAMCIAGFAGFRSTISERTMIGASLGVLLLTAATYFILGVYHPYTANAYIDSFATTVAIFPEHALTEAKIGDEVEIAIDLLPGRVEPRRLHRRLVGLCQAASAGSSKAA
jgi:multidrug resistance efflux pump